MNFIIMNISACLIVLIMIAMRKFAINKLNYSVIFLLWFLAILRLVVPFSIASEYSIYNLYYKVKYILVSNEINFNANNADESLLSENLIFCIWLIVFLVSCVSFLITFYISYLKVKKATDIHSYDIYQYIEKQKLKRKITVKLSKDILSPVSFGVVKPVILFPENFDFENKEQLTNILMHEIIHIKYFHFLIKMLCSILLCIYWFNPFVWLLKIFVDKDLEIICDRKVIMTLGKEKKKSYSESLLNCALNSKNKENNVYNYFIKNSLEERLDAIMNLKKVSVFTTIVSSVLLIGTSLVFATTDVYVENDEFNEIEVISVEPQEENLKANFSEEVPYIELEYSDIRDYIIQDKTRASSYIVVNNYEYVSYGSIPKTLSISLKYEGYTYSGTLTLSNYVYNKDTDKYTGYYSGKLYR